MGTRVGMAESSRRQVFLCSVHKSKWMSFVWEAVFLGVKMPCRLEWTHSWGSVGGVYVCASVAKEWEKHGHVSWLVECVQTDCTSVVQPSGQVMAIEHLLCARQHAGFRAGWSLWSFLFPWSYLSHFPTRTWTCWLSSWSPPPTPHSNNVFYVSIPQGMFVDMLVGGEPGEREPLQAGRDAQPAWGPWSDHDQVGQ